MKKIRKMLCAAMAVVTALSASVISNAEENNSLYTAQTETSEAIGTTDSDGYVLISEEKYVDGDFFIVDRLYEYPDISTYAGTTTSKTFKETRTIYNKDGKLDDDSNGTKVATMWASGKFAWNPTDDTATVSNVQAGFDDFSDSRLSITAVEGYPKSGSNQGMTFLGGKNMRT